MTVKGQPDQWYLALPQPPLYASRSVTHRCVVISDAPSADVLYKVAGMGFTIDPVACPTRSPADVLNTLDQLLTGAPPDVDEQLNLVTTWMWASGAWDTNAALTVTARNRVDPRVRTCWDTH